MTTDVTDADMNVLEKYNIGSVCRADRDCTPVRTMTQRWVHVNPQSEIMFQHWNK